MKNRINICFASDANYAKYMGIAISSILRHKNKEDDIHIYVLDGGILQEDKLKIQSSEKISYFEIEYVKMDKDVFANFPLGETHLSSAAYYRLMVAGIFPNIDRIIYLDCDLIVRKSLSELMSVDMGKNLCMGIIDITYKKNCRRLRLEQYVNSGVLVIDLDGWRKNNIEQNFIDYIREHNDKILFHDQDVINVVLEGKIGLIDMLWNVQVFSGTGDLADAYRRIGKDSYIIHFITREKPWKLYKMKLEEYWWKEAKNSPWFDRKMKTIHLMNKVFCNFYKIWHSLFYYGGERNGKFRTYKFFGIKFRKRRKLWYLENKIEALEDQDYKILKILQKM